MTRRELVLKSLYEYSKGELIYKRYYELRNDDAARTAYLASVEDYVRKHYLFIQEYPFIAVPAYFSEMNIPPRTGITAEMNVHLMKHLRYTPIFPHKQDFFELAYVLSGSCNQVIDGEEVPLKQGDLCFIPPLVMHTLEVFDDSVVINVQMRRDTFGDLFFNSLRLNSILSDFFMSFLYSQTPAKRIVFSTGDDESIRNIVLDMFEECMFRDEYSERVLNSMIPMFLVKTLRGYSQTASLKTNISQVKSSQTALRLISYINDNYQDITLEKLANHFSYSVPHCSKLIRDETGMSFVFFVRHVRMTRAASILTSTNIPVAVVGEMVGYENTESFIRAFQKEFSQSPSAYRKNALQNNGS